jgi:hypothetical protein
LASIIIPTTHSKKATTESGLNSDPTKELTDSIAPKVDSVKDMPSPATAAATPSRKESLKRKRVQEDQEDDNAVSHHSISYIPVF